MNLVGKIFVVLILVASTVFMTIGLMVLAAHINWQEAVEGGRTASGAKKPGLIESLNDVTLKLAQLQAQIDKLQTVKEQEKKAQIQALAKAEAERQNIIKERDKAVSDVADLSVKLEKSNTAMKAAQDNLASLRKEAADLREGIRVANQATDEQLKKATELEDKLHTAEVNLKDLKARNEQLAGQVANAVVLLKSVGISIADPPNRVAPTIYGKILALNQDDHAEIDLGSDDGLREGHTLEIFRNNKYLGRMTVVEVHPHRAVGKMIKESLQDVIRKEDEVATRLKG